MTCSLRAACILAVLALAMPSPARTAGEAASFEDQQILAAMVEQLCAQNRASGHYFVPSRSAVVDAFPASAGLDESVRQSLVARNRTSATLPSVKLCNGLRAKDSKTLDEELESLSNRGTPERWAALFVKHRGLKGIIRFSLPGYSSKGDVAVVQVAIACGWLCGNGSYWFMKKVSGRWQVDKDVWLPGWQS